MNYDAEYPGQDEVKGPGFYIIRSDTPRPCVYCSQPTVWWDELAGMAFLCSAECCEQFWENYYEDEAAAAAKEFDDNQQDALPGVI